MLSPVLAAALPDLLAETPDPDTAALYFLRLLEENGDGVSRLLTEHPVLAHYAIVIFGHSRFLGETLIRNTDLLPSFLSKKVLDRSCSREELVERLAQFRSRCSERDAALVLARFKRREYVRIMLRDVLRIASLAETTSEISALSDVLIEAALREAEICLQSRYGSPGSRDAGHRSGGLAVLSLGKLGGNELNYCSDVDLFYIFSDEEQITRLAHNASGEPQGLKPSNSEDASGMTKVVPFPVVPAPHLTGPSAPAGETFRLRSGQAAGQPAGRRRYDDVSAGSEFIASPKAFMASPEAMAEPISAREYFIRLAQELTGLLSRPTAEGALFRLDLRLRPQGREGELAISLSQALRYYARTAEDWERQAQIKARFTAGDESVGRRFIREVQSEVYGFGSAEQAKPLNFAAIKTALVAREKMDRHLRFTSAREPASNAIDVKLDHGGIRDIEFLVQCLQRVHGGRDPWLRSGGTLFSLHRLHDKGALSNKDFHELSGTYEFLRHLEHRLQLRQGQQIHRLATSAGELEILRKSMEKHGIAGERAKDLPGVLRKRMAAVSAIYKRVIFRQEGLDRSAESGGVEFVLSGGMEAVAGEASDAPMLSRLAQDAPRIHETVSRGGLSPQARKNALRFLSAAFTRSERYAAVLRDSEAFANALILFDMSEYLSDMLARHPEEFGTLGALDDAPPVAGAGYLFDVRLGEEPRSSDPVFGYIVSSAASHGEKLSLLRKQYRHRTFVEGARDLTSRREVYSSLRGTSAAAEDAIRAVLGLAGNPAGLAVLSLGGLGSREFDICSDADLLFVCEDASSIALARSVEGIVQSLASYTQDGTLFPVDLRLRPRGTEGELLVSVSGLESYFGREAQAWEALMYTKLRYIAGDRQQGERALTAARILFSRFAEDAAFTPAVREMRQKLEASSGRNFKTSPGAIYDLDFITGYLLVKHGTGCCGHSLRDRIWQCASRGLLAGTDAATLDHAAELLRTTEHVTKLTVGRATEWLPVTPHPREVTEEVVGSILGGRFPDGLEAELEASCGGVRRIYERTIG